LLFIVALSLTNCQVEEIATDENTIKTVSKEEAMLYLAQNTITSRSIKGKKQAETADLNNIAQEKITNSDQLLTVIPLSNNTRTRYSRILLIKIKDELKSIVFTMYPDTDATAQDFSGIIMLNKIDGTFVNGFRAKKGLLVSKLATINTKTSYNLRSAQEPIPLDEVIIINKFPVITYIWDRPEDVKPEYNYLWDGGFGGGGGPAVEPEPDTDVDPCNQIKDLLDFNSGQTNNIKSNIKWLEDKVKAIVNVKEAGVEVKKQ
jgi:hypothetical protein